MTQRKGFNTTMTGAISQMQMLYNAEEDRILFRVNTTAAQEFRFWVTRRYAALMLRVLKEHVDSDPDVGSQGTPEAKEAVRAFKQEKAVQSANFAEQFREEASEMPLGQEALLAYRLQYNIKDGVLNLGVQPKDGQGINMAINQQINSSLTQLLVAAIRKAEWNLVAAPSAVSTQETRVIN